MMRAIIPGLSKKNLGREFVSGLTLLALAIPINVGYAQVAGLPASAGLYALVIPTLLFAFFASSRQVVVAPNAATATLIGTSLAGLGAGDNIVVMAAAQALTCGIILLIAAAFKLGSLAEFLSKPILVGFMAGLGIDISVGQIAKMLGLEVSATAPFIERVWQLLTSLGDMQLWPPVVGLSALLFLLGGARVRRGIPWALLVMVAGIVCSWLFSFEDLGVEVLGDISVGWSALAVPIIPLSQWMLIIPSAVAIAAITMAEGLMVSRNYAESHRVELDPNRDVAAFGLANIAAGLSSSFAVGPSTSRTATMNGAGSRTQFPSIVVAVGALALIIFGTSLLAPTPQPVIGAIVLVAVLSLMRPRRFRKILAQTRSEFWIAITCMLLVVAVGPLNALLIAFGLTLVNLVRRMSQAPVQLLSAPSSPDDHFTVAEDDGQEFTAPGVVMLRIMSPIFFANSSELAARILEQQRPDVHALVLDCSGVSDVDVTGGERVRRAIREVKDRGTAVYFTRVQPRMKPGLEQSGLMSEENEFVTNRDAFEHISSVRD